MFGGPVYTVKVITNMELNSSKAEDGGHLVQVNVHAYKYGI